jgi:hypothetical protein
MKRFAIACVAILGLIAVGSTTANAGDFQVRFGGFGGQRGFKSAGPSFHQGSHGHHNNHGHHGHHDIQVFHDTSHYDWVPGHWEFHHGHYDWVPGRYVFHQDGLIDTIQQGHGHSHAH